MSIMDKFLDAIRLNDSTEDEDGFLDDEDDLDEQPKKRFFQRMGDTERDDEEDLDEPESEEPKRNSFFKKKETKTDRNSGPASDSRSQGPQTSSKVTPMRRKTSGQNLEVCVIKPASMEDTREIADTLLAGCAVLLNLEGMDYETAQRIIDFCCGSSYSINGDLKKVATSIFMLTPASVAVTGDIQSMLGTAFDMPNIRTEY